MFDYSRFFGGVIGLIDGLLMVYLWVVIGRVLISWVNPDPYNRIVQVLCGLTDPALNGLRRVIPSFLWSTGLDFTPLILILVIQLLRIFLGNLHL